MPKGILAAIFSLLAILGLLFLVWPKYQQLNKLKAEEKIRLIQSQKREEYFSNLRQISSQLGKYQEALEKVDEAIPQNFQGAKLLNFLSKSSQESGLLLTGIGSINQAKLTQKNKEGKEIISETQIKETSLSLKASGSYPSLKNFLNLLEKSARLIEVENISFSSSKTNVFQYNLLLKVYSY